MKSIRTKFITLIIIVILLFTTLIILYSYQRIKENYTQTLTTNLKYLNISLIELIKPLLINNNIDSLVLKVNNLGDQTNDYTLKLNGTDYIRFKKISILRNNGNGNIIISVVMVIQLQLHGFLPIQFQFNRLPLRQHLIKISALLLVETIPYHYL